MNIGKRIIEIRKDNNLSQEQFAEMFFVTRQTVSNWENCKSYPDIETIVKISDTFDVSLDILLKQDKRLIKDIDHKISNVSIMNNDANKLLSKIRIYFRIPFFALLMSISFILLFPSMPSGGWTKDLGITINISNLFTLLGLLIVGLILFKEIKIKDKLRYKDIFFIIFFNKINIDNKLGFNNIGYFISIMFSLIGLPLLSNVLLSKYSSYVIYVMIGLVVIIPILYILYNKVILKKKSSVKEIFFDVIFEQDEEIKKESK